MLRPRRGAPRRHPLSRYTRRNELVGAGCLTQHEGRVFAVGRASRPATAGSHGHAPRAPMPMDPGTPTLHTEAGGVEWLPEYPLDWASQTLPPERRLALTLALNLALGPEVLPLIHVILF